MMNLRRDGQPFYDSIETADVANMRQAAEHSCSTCARILPFPYDDPPPAASDVSSLRLRLDKSSTRIRGALEPPRAARSARSIYVEVWAAAAALSGVTTLLACALIHDLIAPVRPAPAKAQEAPRSTSAGNPRNDAIAASHPASERKGRDFGDSKRSDSFELRGRVETTPPAPDREGRATGPDEGALRTRKSPARAAPTPDEPAPRIAPAPPPPAASEASVCALLDAGESRCMDSLSHLNIL